MAKLARISRYLILLSLASFISVVTLLALQGHDENPEFPPISLDHPAIRYVDSAPNDPVARLQKRLDKGEVKLEFDAKTGYLRSVLQLLGINVDSQVLVFSKTSSQVSQISPVTPRAIYFRDDASVGYVQRGRVLEFAALDPKEGMIFYTMETGKSAKPEFSREELNCLQCHMSPATLNIPGIMVSSLYPSSESFGGVSAFATDHRIPLEERWGGWYVTGLHGTLHHRGNAIFDSFGNLVEGDAAQTQNVTSLAGRINTGDYVAPTSDIVALMTLEHQTRMSNLITRIAWETRTAISDGKLKNFQSRLDADVEEFVTYMTFADEAAIPSPIQGVSSFTKTFAERGPRDKQGRSLRDFDLQKRLFRYPLSYMIYSAAFDSIPSIARDKIYRKLYDVLTGKDTDSAFAKLSSDDRRAVFEILMDTKPGLPAYWRRTANTPVPSSQ